MAVLVAYASAHGSTRSIAERIGPVPAEHGERVEVRAVSSVGGADTYKAIVLGSAAHSWLAEATDFLERERDTLAKRPVWLLSVGMPPPSAALGAATAPRKRPYWRTTSTECSTPTSTGSSPGSSAASTFPSTTATIGTGREPTPGRRRSRVS